MPSPPAASSPSSRGVDLRIYSPTRSARITCRGLRNNGMPPPDLRIVLMPARLARRKGHRTLIRAARILAETGRRDLLFILAGDGARRLSARNRRFAEDAGVSSLCAASAIATTCRRRWRRRPAWSRRRCRSRKRSAAPSPSRTRGRWAAASPPMSAPGPKPSSPRPGALRREDDGLADAAGRCRSARRRHRGALDLNAAGRTPWRCGRGGAPPTSSPSNGCARPPCRLTKACLEPNQPG